MAQAREAWWNRPDGVGGIDPERLIFLDECGVLTNLVRLHGRSPRGTRACASAPLYGAFGVKRFPCGSPG